MIVSGMTDLQIVAEALKHEGFTHEDIFEPSGSSARELHDSDAAGDQQR